MATAPLFSIVLPVFQARETLSRAIASVRHQSFEDWELLIVDDGSTDGSIEIAKEEALDHSRIQVLSIAINRGPGPPSNHGVRQASGDYVLFLHADDEFHPEALSQLQKEIVSNPRDLVFFGADELRRGRVRNLHDPSLSRTLSTQRATLTLEDFPELIMWPPSAWTRCYRREFLSNNNLSFPDGSYEDIPWTVECSLLAKSVSVIDSVVYRYNTGAQGTSITTTMSSGALVRVSQVKKVREIVKNSGPGTRLTAHIAALMAVHLIWANKAAYRTIPPSDRARFFTSSSNEMKYWAPLGALSPKVSSAPLLPTSERIRLGRILRKGSYTHWNRYLRATAALKRVLNYFDPKRW